LVEESFHHVDKGNTNLQEINRGVSDDDSNALLGSLSATLRARNVFGSRCGFYFKLFQIDSLADKVAGTGSHGREDPVDQYISCDHNHSQAWFAAVKFPQHYNR
jgi:hypothetical protein